MEEESWEFDGWMGFTTEDGETLTTFEGGVNVRVGDVVSAAGATKPLPSDFKGFRFVPSCPTGCNPDRLRNCVVAKVRVPDGVRSTNIWFTSLADSLQVVELMEGEFVRDGGRETSTWVGGQLHRNALEGPAWIRYLGPPAAKKISFSIFYEKGVEHRPTSKGPAFTLFGKGGVITKEVFRINGKIHRAASDGPALTERDEAGGLKREIYYNEGVVDRDPLSGPAKTEWYTVREDGEDGEDGAKTKHRIVRTYVVGGKTHRSAAYGPAVIVTDRAGKLMSETFYEDGKPHRTATDGPAHIEYDDAGNPETMVYYNKGVVDRAATYGPAKTEHFTARVGGQENRRLTTHTYVAGGKVHRRVVDGPAVVATDQAGKVVSESFYESGKYLSHS